MIHPNPLVDSGILIAGRQAVPGEEPMEKPRIKLGALPNQERMLIEQAPVRQPESLRNAL
jgi:hypothetical protein